MGDEWDDLVTVGRIARSHGLRGEVAIVPETDFAQARFAEGRRVFARRGGRVDALTIRSLRFHGGRPLVGFEGIESRTDADLLGKLELRAPADEIGPAPEGSFYHRDLVGCQVRTTDGELVGLVTDVERAGGGHTLVVGRSRGDALIPLASAICVRIDTAARVIEIDPPEGLLELNEPGPRRRTRP